MSHELQSRAMLAYVKINLFGMKAKDVDATDAANKNFGVGADAGDYQKCKIARADVADILKFANRARAAHREFTMPFTDAGYRILPAVRIMDYTHEMSLHKTNFEDAVADLVTRWPQVVVNSINRLKGLHKASDYPTQAQIAGHYSIKFDMIAIPDQDHIVLNLEKEIVDQLKSDLQESNRRNLRKAMRDIWIRLYDPIKHMNKTLSQDKRIYDSMTGNIERVVDLIPIMNLAGDQGLIDIAVKIKTRLLAYPTDQIRDDENLRNTLAMEAQLILAEIDAQLKETPEEAEANEYAAAATA